MSEVVEEFGFIREESTGTSGENVVEWRDPTYKFCIRTSKEGITLQGYSGPITDVTNLTLTLLEAVRLHRLWKRIGI